MLTLHFTFNAKMLLEFLMQNNLFPLKSYFQKKPQWNRAWTSPDGITKNEIISNRKNIVGAVTVLNKFSIGSDHRIVRSLIEFNLKEEKRKLIRKTTKWDTLVDVTFYQQEIEAILGHRIENEFESHSVKYLPST